MLQTERLLQEFIVVSSHYASTGQLPSQLSTSQATVNDESNSEEDNGMHSLNHIGNRQAPNSMKRRRGQEQDNANQPGRSQKLLRTNESLQSSSREWKFSSMEQAGAYLTSHGHSTILGIANKYLLSQRHPLICIERTAGATSPANVSRLTSNDNLTRFRQYEQQPSKARSPSSGAR